MTNTRNGLDRKKFRIKPYKCSMGEEDRVNIFFYWSCNVMKVEINSFFFGICVELFMLYTHDYA